MAEFGSRLDIDTRPFILHGYPGTRADKAVILQDAGRGVVALLQFTLMSQISTAGGSFEKWVPFTDLVAVDGTAIPSGIYMGEDIAGADLVAGDVLDVPIITGGVKFDEDKLVFDEDTRAYTDVIAASNAAAVYFKRTVRQTLTEKQLIPQATASNTSFENA